MHAHDHPGRGPGRLANRRRMAAALAINVALLVAGIAGALLFDSVALLADAGHVLSDLGAIGLGLAAATIAVRPAAGRRTFGSGRTEILAALANGVTLVVVAVLVIVEAAGRLSDPPDVEGLGVLVVGVLGLAGNAAATLLLAGGDREDLNLEGVLRHSAADALGSLGVIVAGVLVLATGWREADAVVGILIGALILAGSWRLVREPVDVLMEAAPRGVDVEQVGEAMAGVTGVREVHDLHVWTVTSGFPALAAHVVCDPHDEVDAVRGRLELLLRERFGIEHTTLQATAAPLLELEDRRGGG
ncbi:MAG: cation diffusion facilitator family transporter [Thermoleophilaceae bacterium]